MAKNRKNNNRNNNNEYFQAYNRMVNAWSEVDAEEAYKDACAARQKMCPGKCGMTDCSRCFLTKQYWDIRHEIRRRPAVSVTVNLWGCNVSIKTK